MGIKIVVVLIFIYILLEYFFFLEFKNFVSYCRKNKKDFLEYLKGIYIKEMVL